MYCILESDTNDLGSTIHFDEKNLETFGMRIYNLFFMSCNLFEFAAKEMAKDTYEEIVKSKAKEKGWSIQKAIKSTRNDMNVWREDQLIRQYSNHEPTFIPMGFQFKPLEFLGKLKVEERILPWWSDYNSVKHDLSQIQKATLRNLIYALCSAGILVSHVGITKGFIRGIMKPSVLFSGVQLPSINY